MSHGSRALALLVGAAAVTLQGCGQGTSPPSTTASASPTVPAYELEPLEPAVRADWLTEVPDGIRLDVALPEDGGDFRRGRVGTAFEFCGVEAFSSDDDLDRAVVSVSGPEHGEGRDLRVFADDRAAHGFLGHVVSVVQACPDQQTGGATWRHELRPSRLDGDAAFTAVQSFFVQDGLPVLGASFWEVVRVGNAVLLTTSGGEYEPTTSLDPGIRRHAAEVADIVEEMCVFAARPCGAAPVEGTSTHRTVVGPHGFGNISLGDDADTVEGFGGRVTSRRTASGCRIVDLWVNDGPDLVGNLEAGLGLSVIHVPTAGRTDRGVGIGSPMHEVLAAYPRGHGDGQLYSSDVAGYDDRHWRFWFDREGSVDEFMLLLDDQHCGG